MNRTNSLPRRVGRNTGRSLQTHLFDNWRLILLTAFFIGGLAAGAISSKYTDTVVLEKLMTVFGNYSAARGSQSMLATFGNALSSGLLYFLFTFICGLCAVGLPFVAAVPFIRGLGLGMIGGYLYAAQGLAGVGYYALILLPGALLSVVALLLAGSESVKMSLGMLFSVASSHPPLIHSAFRTFCIKYCFLFAVMACSAVLDAFLIKAFGGFFSF